MNNLPEAVAKFLNELWAEESEFLTLYMEELEEGRFMTEPEVGEVIRWFEGDMSTNPSTEGVQAP